MKFIIIISRSSLTALTLFFYFLRFLDVARDLLLNRKQTPLLVMSAFEFVCGFGVHISFVL